MASKVNKIAAAFGAVRAEIDSVRERIAAKRAEHAQLRGASVTRAEALARLDRHIAGLAANFRPPVGQFIGADRHGSMAIWPGVPGEADQFIAWAFPDVLRAKLTAAIDAELKASPPGLACEERSVALEQLEDEILVLELAEESIIREAADSGFRVQRRPDADPRAVLAKLAA